MDVLIVDDSVIVRERLIEMLGGVDGVRVVGQADNAEEGAHLADAMRPDVAIVDLNLRDGGTGLDVLRAIRRNGAESVVIVLTNHPEPINRAACLADGADYFFDKSANFGRIEPLLRLMLRTQH